MTSPATPSTRPPDAPAPRLRPLAGFLPVFGFGLGLLLRGRRFLVVAIVAGFVGALLGFEGVQGKGRQYDPAMNLWEILDEAVLRYAVPLVALLLVAQGWAREVQDRTLVYHLVRPVARSTVFLARFSAGLVGAALATVALVGALLACSGIDLPPTVWLDVLGASLLATLAMGAVYYALAATFRFGTIVGLVYTFVVESVLSASRGTMQQLSVTYHARSLLHRWTDDVFRPLMRRPEVIDGTPRPESLDEGAGLLLRAADRIAWEEPSEAILVLSILAAAALLVGILVVRRKDYALKD